MKNFTVGLALILVWMVATGAPKKTDHEIFEELGADARAVWVDSCRDCGLTFEVHALVIGHPENYQLFLTFVELRARTKFERSLRGVDIGAVPYSAEHQ